MMSIPINELPKIIEIQDWDRLKFIFVV
jgi:hypothetical protein